MYLSTTIYCIVNYVFAVSAELYEKYNSWMPAYYMCGAAFMISAVVVFLEYCAKIHGRPSQAQSTASFDQVTKL